LPATFTFLVPLALFSLTDLRYRLAPGIGLFFLGAVLLAAPGDPLRAGAAVLATAWGLCNAPGFLALPLLCHPSSWTVLFTGCGVRQGVVGRADLLAMGGIAALYPWPAALLALVGVELWRRWWRARHGGPAPAILGMFLGVSAYLVFSRIVP